MYSVQRLERWWWQLFWQLHRQCLPVGVMADIAVTEGGMLSNMPRPVKLKAANKLRGANSLRVANTCGPRGAMGATQVAHIIGMAVATGEAVIGMVAVTGEVVTGT